MRRVPFRPRSGCDALSAESPRNGDVGLAVLAILKNELRNLGFFGGGVRKAFAPRTAGQHGASGDEGPGVSEQGRIFPIPPLPRGSGGLVFPSAHRSPGSSPRPGLHQARRVSWHLSRRDTSEQPSVSTLGTAHKRVPSRRDIMKIAQRFNAGFCGRNTPQSRRDGRRISRCFFRP